VAGGGTALIRASIGSVKGIATTTVV